MNAAAKSLLASMLVAAVGCTVTPQQELQLGADSHAQFEKESGGLYPDASVTAYVSSVGMKMVPLAARPDMNWQFHVVSAADVNAFAVPGGYIYITQGLLFKLQNEAQLAGVLGHETGHIHARHSAKQQERSQTIGIFTAGVGVIAEQAGYAAAGQLGSAASQLYLLKYGRDQETEADYLGLGYMSKVGYNPEAMVSVMELLKQVSGGSGGKMAEWTSTHPDPGNRAEYLEAAIQQKYQAAKASGVYNEQQFQAAVLSRKPRTAAIYRTTEEAIAAGVPGISVEQWRRGEVVGLLATSRPTTQPASPNAAGATSMPSTRPAHSLLIFDGCKICQQRLLEQQQKKAPVGSELMKDVGLSGDSVDPNADPADGKNSLIKRITGQ